MTTSAQPWKPRPGSEASVCRRICASLQPTRRARSGGSVSVRRAKRSDATSPRTPRHGNSTNSGVRLRRIKVDMAAFESGQIVIADRRDALPKEANELRPAVVVEDGTL